ncbi:MAG: XTP/dITP diphosphatase [Chloroflexota bacterium]
MKLLLATSNRGKLLEFQHLFPGSHFELVTPADLELDLEVAENGTTYAENASLKALAFARASGLITLADDSGLEVDALGGEPGIQSARYAGEGAGDRDRVARLLSRLQDIPWEKRTAHFRCVIAVAAPSGRVDFAEGSCNGIITFEPKGASGFGYDPVFYFPKYGKTMAELPIELKNRISHRGRAAVAALPVIERIVKEARDAGTS